MSEQARDLYLTAAFLNEGPPETLVYVARTAGMNGVHGPTANMTHAATEIAGIRNSHRMYRYTPTAISNDMLQPASGTYVVSYSGDLARFAQQASADVPDGQTFLGYALREPLDPCGDVVRISEIALRPKINDSSFVFALGSLIAGVLDGLPIDPQTPLHIASRMPSPRGQKFLKSVGMAYRIVDRGAGFSGITMTVQANLEMLGHNLYRP